MHVKITNGNVDTYPYNVGQLRRDNPNTSFPRQIPDEMLESYEIFPVTFADEPTIDRRTQKAEQASSPSLVEGAWTIGWTISEKTTEETAKYDADVGSVARENRDGLLADTDWMALSDVTMTTEMTAYRQALRDITTHNNWPHLRADDWPIKP
jgi:hypothetical protein